MDEWMMEEKEFGGWRLRALGRLEEGDRGGDGR